MRDDERYNRYFTRLFWVANAIAIAAIFFGFNDHGVGGAIVYLILFWLLTMVVGFFLSTLFVYSGEIAGGGFILLVIMGVIYFIVQMWDVGRP